jgi:hypothetical protein
MNVILVVVDQFSKMAHIIPMTLEISLQVKAQLLLYHVWKRHGPAQEIVLDQGPQLVSSV